MWKIVEGIYALIIIYSFVKIKVLLSLPKI